jgi:predicted Zn-dependent peptidase
MQFHETVLSNGLRVVAELNDQAHSVSSGFFVRTGARDETGAESGLSHFLEHMLFKGTDRRDALAVNRDLDRVGARHNAMTSEEDTVYHVTALPEYMPAAFDVLADIMRPSLRSDDFDTEKLVIVEEIRMYDDNPLMVAYEAAKEAHFGKHPLGQSVLGTVDSITDMKVGQMHDYFNRRYSPANIVLAFSGKGRWDDLLKLAEAKCGHWKNAPGAGRETFSTTGHGGFRQIHRPDDMQQMIVMMASAPALEDPMRHAASVLATAFGDATGSRLYWELVHPGHAEMCDFGYQEYNQAGAFMLFLGCDPENAEANLDRISHVIHKLRDTGLSQEEIDRARNKTLSRAVIRAERPMGRLLPLGSYYTYLGRHVSLDEDIASLNAVTVEQVNQLLEKFPLRPMALSSIGPRNDLTPVD